MAGAARVSPSLSFSIGTGTKPRAPCGGEAPLGAGLALLWAALLACHHDNSCGWLGCLASAPAVVVKVKNPAVELGEKFLK